MTYIYDFWFYFMCVKSLYSPRVGVGWGVGDSHIKTTGVLVGIWKNLRDTKIMFYGRGLKCSSSYLRDTTTTQFILVTCFMGV